MADEERPAPDGKREKTGGGGNGTPGNQSFVRLDDVKDAEFLGNTYWLNGGTAVHVVKGEKLRFTNETFHGGTQPEPPPPPPPAIDLLPPTPLPITTPGFWRSTGGGILAGWPKVAGTAVAALLCAVGTWAWHHFFH